MFSNIAKAGIAKIYSEDKESQEHYINIFCKEVRHMKPDIVYKADGVFIPNNEYMKIYFGSEIVEENYDCYDYNGTCYWHDYIIFPIYNLIDDIVGLVGFNPVNKVVAVSENKWELNFYRQSGKKLMDKSKYLFMLKGTFERAYKDGYLIITDGVFDMLSAQDAGLNASALLGSYLSEEVLATLRFIDKIYLSVDNDEAGLKLLKQLRKSLPKSRAIIQNVFKDLDDILTSEYREEFLEEFKYNLSLDINIDLIFKKKGKIKKVQG